jgi:hypothetical protein
MIIPFAYNINDWIIGTEVKLNGKEVSEYSSISKPIGCETHRTAVGDA